MMRILLQILTLTVALFGLHSPVLADGFTQALQQLAQYPVVRAPFEQSKHIANVQKPMQSSGQLLFVKNTGVLWQLKTPVQADLIVTPKKMVQKTARTQSVVNLKQTPYGPAANVLLQLMSGNEKALRQHFEVSQFQQNGAAWQASLTPKSQDMKSLFARIDIQAAQTYVSQLTLLDAQKRPTVIRFQSPHNAPTTLSAQEHALFKLAQ